MTEDGSQSGRDGSRHSSRSCCCVRTRSSRPMSLIEELWRGEPPATGAKSLQVYVSRLRKRLGADVIATRVPGYSLRVGRDQLDLLRFERLVGEARGVEAPEAAAATLRDALSLWRGPPLAEFANEAWAQPEIGRLEELRLAALEDRIDADLALRRHADVVGELEVLVSGNPYRERLCGQLMLALYRSGRQAEALAAYRDTRRVLDQELGLEPGGELESSSGGFLLRTSGRARPARYTRWRRRPAAPGSGVGGGSSSSSHSWR